MLSQRPEFPISAGSPVDARVLWWPGNNPRPIEETVPRFQDLGVGRGAANGRLSFSRKDGNICFWRDVAGAIRSRADLALALLGMSVLCDPLVSDVATQRPENH